MEAVVIQASEDKMKSNPEIAFFGEFGLFLVAGDNKVLLIQDHDDILLETKAKKINDFLAKSSLLDEGE